MKDSFTLARRDLIALVAAILAAGRCSPTGETLIDSKKLLEDAAVLVNDAEMMVARGL